MKSRLFLAGWALVIIGLVGLPAAAIGAGGDAAVLYTIMRGVGDEEKDALWGYTKEVLGRYYTVLPDEQVLPAYERAQAAGCEEEACLRAVKEALGTPVVLQLFHIDEGYFNQLYLTKLTGDGVVKKHYTCTRCSHIEFQVILNRLTRKFQK